METNSFLINEYINKNASNIDLFKKNLYSKGILSKDYPDENLILLYNKYNNENKNPIEMECRSIILDRNSFEIICYTCNTPISNTKALNYILEQKNQKKEIYNCYEGTLMSLFYHNDKWFLSTRRCLDSKKSIINNISHYDMFLEVLKEDGYEMFDDFTKNLNNKYCYYFILINHKNINLVDYTSKFGSDYKKLCLAFIRNKESQNEIDLLNENNINLDFLSENIFLPEKINDLSLFDEENKKCSFDKQPDKEGVVIKIKVNNMYKLLKLQTLNYQFHKAIGPKKNIFRGFIHLYQINKLLDYFKNNLNFEKYKKIVNPINTKESYDTIGTVDAIFKVLTSELYSLFRLLWDFKKSKNMNEKLYNYLPKEYKDILFGIKGLLFKIKNDNIKKNQKNYLKIKDIYNYLKTIDSENIEKLLRSRKLMFNLVKIEYSVPELKLFNSTSDRCDKVHLKLIAIYTNILFPEIMPDDVPKKKNL